MSLVRALSVVLLLAAPAPVAARQDCPPGLVAVEGRCLAPDVAEQVRQAPRVQERPADTRSGRACCKRCTKGKPCGDSCIAVSRTCRKGPGCAC